MSLWKKGELNGECLEGDMFLFKDYTLDKVILTGSNRNAGTQFDAIKK